MKSVETDYELHIKYEDRNYPYPVIHSIPLDNTRKQTVKEAILKHKRYIGKGGKIKSIVLLTTLTIKRKINISQL
jgi:hypothetical protein